jgi:signal transduction histidine kinase
MEMIRLSNPPKEISEEVDTLYKCASGQLEFINSLLEILRLESGAARLRITPIDINLPVNQSVQNLGPAIKAKELELQMDLNQEIPNVHCDIARVSQLVTNLLSNAIKFTPRHGIVKISTSYSQNSNLGCAEVSIEDSGEGIEPEHRERLMKRFIRGKAGGSDGEQGSGLGLSICKEIVNLHSGALIIGESPLGGAMVRARLPLGGAADGQESGSEDRMAPGPQRVIARRP